MYLKHINSGISNLSRKMKKRAFLIAVLILVLSCLICSIASYSDQSESASLLAFKILIVGAPAVLLLAVISAQRLAGNRILLEFSYFLLVAGLVLSNEWFVGYLFSETFQVNLLAGLALLMFCSQGFIF